MKDEGRYIRVMCVCVYECDVFRAALQKTRHYAWLRPPLLIPSTRAGWQCGSVAPGGSVAQRHIGATTAAV